MPYQFSNNDLREIYLAIQAGAIPDPANLAQESTLLTVSDNIAGIWDGMKNSTASPSVFKDPGTDTSWFAKQIQFMTTGIDDLSVFKEPITGASWLFKIKGQADNQSGYQDVITARISTLKNLKQGVYMITVEYTNASRATLLTAVNTAMQGGAGYPYVLWRDPPQFDSVAAVWFQQVTYSTAT
jgi:hypothetical protein